MPDRVKEALARRNKERGIPEEVVEEEEEKQIEEDAEKPEPKSSLLITPIMMAEGEKMESEEGSRGFLDDHDKYEEAIMSLREARL